MKSNRIDQEIDRVLFQKWRAEEMIARDHKRATTHWVVRNVSSIAPGLWIYDERKNAYGIVIGPKPDNRAHWEIQRPSGKVTVPGDATCLIMEYKDSQSCTCDVCSLVEERNRFREHSTDFH